MCAIIYHLYIYYSPNIESVGHSAFVNTTPIQFYITSQNMPLLVFTYLYGLHLSYNGWIDGCGVWFGS